MDVDYLKHETPDEYVCSECGAARCKLWRQYQTLASHVALLCARCAGADQDKDVSSIDADGRRLTSDGDRTDQIGWLVPAVPIDDTYWGYTSVPEEGVTWWRRLLTLPWEATP